MSANKPAGAPVITLMTDFGERDGYAGCVKGVILSACPGANIVDITHCAPAFNISSAAYVLSSYWEEFPPGTIHVAVVDPGVGSDRKAVAVKYSGRWFVAPDNGILSYSLRGAAKYSAREISANFTSGRKVSATFHGRDVFAPAAAHIAKGGAASALGPAVKELRFLDGAVPSASKNGVSGRVIHIDSFGNLVTNIRNVHIPPGTPAGSVITRVAGLSIIGLSKTYSDKKQGELVAYIGSCGYLEIGIVKGAASSVIRTPEGRQVNVFFREKKTGRKPQD